MEQIFIPKLEQKTISKEESFEHASKLFEPIGREILNKDGEVEIENEKLKIKFREGVTKLTPQHLNLIKEELNVKEVEIEYFKSVENLAHTEIELDTKITPELKQEGNYRELVRALQDMRKKMGLTPSDLISVVFETEENGKKLIQKFEADMKKTVLISELKFENNDGEEVKIDDLLFKVKIEK